MALNVGRRPSWGEGADVTVEAHILHGYPEDFYGRHLRVLVSGFLRCPHAHQRRLRAHAPAACHSWAVHARKQAGASPSSVCMSILFALSGRMDQLQHRSHPSQTT